METDSLFHIVEQFRQEDHNELAWLRGAVS